MTSGLWLSHRLHLSVPSMSFSAIFDVAFQSWTAEREQMRPVRLKAATAPHRGQEGISHHLLPAYLPSKCPERALSSPASPFLSAEEVISLVLTSLSGNEETTFWGSLNSSGQMKIQMSGLRTGAWTETQVTPEDRWSPMSPNPTVVQREKSFTVFRCSEEAGKG